MEQQNNDDGQEMIIKYHELCVNVVHHPRPLVASIQDLELLCTVLTTFLRGYTFEVDAGPKGGIVISSWPTHSPPSLLGNEEEGGGGGGGGEGEGGVPTDVLYVTTTEESSGSGPPSSRRHNGNRESAYKSFLFETSNSFAHVARVGDKRATFPLSRRNMVALALVTRGDVPKFVANEVAAFRLAFGFVFGQRMAMERWRFVRPRL